jgi:hypothetical protein
MRFVLSTRMEGVYCRLGGGQVKGQGGVKVLHCYTCSAAPGLVLVRVARWKARVG